MADNNSNKSNAGRPAGWFSPVSARLKEIDNLASEARMATRDENVRESDLVAIQERIAELAQELPALTREAYQTSLVERVTSNPDFKRVQGIVRTMKGLPGATAGSVRTAVEPFLKDEWLPHLDFDPSD